MSEKAALETASEKPAVPLQESEPGMVEGGAEEGMLLETHQPSAPVMISPDAETDATTQCACVLQTFSVIFIILFFPFSLICCLSMVQEYERAVIFRLGRILHGGAKGPGLFFTYPCMDSIVKVDMRTAAHDIKPQEILTKDHVTVAVDAVIYTRVVDPILSVTRVDNVIGSCKLLGATTLRNILGTYTMTDLLAQRDAINTKMRALLDEATDPWGVLVERVEITDVTLPSQLQRAMAAEAEANREAKAKIISAEGEEKAARSLKEAAMIMMDAPGAIQLRYLQTLNTIAAEKNSTIVFPLPMDLLQSFTQPRPSMYVQPPPVNLSQPTPGGMPVMPGNVMPVINVPAMPSPGEPVTSMDPPLTS